MTEWINCGERDCSAAMRRTASSIPEGGATGNGPGEASTTCGGTTAPATLTSVTGLGLTTTLLTSFPVRRSGRTTLVTRCGTPRPAPDSTPAAKPATVSVKQNWRKMFPLILALKPALGTGLAANSTVDRKSV